MNHIEVDVADITSLIFSDFCALRLTDGVKSKVIVGSTYYTGYAEGRGAEARFDLIASFAQINQSLIIAVDVHNNCLRLINRITRSTLPLAGLCKSFGEFPNEFNSAIPYIGFWSIVKHKGSSTQFIV